MPSLTLIVLRAADLPLTLAFYRTLGLDFSETQRGKGPVHYTCVLGGLLLELYPGKPGAAPERAQAGAVMLGFTVESLDAVLDALNAPVVTPPQTTSWGRRAVVLDPDGRAVDLSEALE
jgi:predicted enzyme related to lactoylglutathione lyase